MRTMLIALVAALIFFNTSSAHADGLLYQLPEDGAWVLFDTQGKMTHGDQSQEFTGSLRMSSVGKVTEDDKPCRWIEFELTINLGERSRLIVAKVLIPEAELKEGQQPVDNRVRGYVKMGAEGEAVVLNEGNLGPIPAFLANPLLEKQELKAEVVESKLGKLSCRGLTGFVEFAEGTATNHATFNTRRHEKAPFGVVTCQMNIKATRDGTVTDRVEMPLVLSDFGVDAKTKLPDQN